jgi:hypothetical protein
LRHSSLQHGHVLKRWHTKSMKSSGNSWPNRSPTSLKWTSF